MSNGIKNINIKGLLPTCIGIIATMAIVPQMYLTSSVAIPLAILGIYSILLFLFRQKGAPYILVAMALCMPCVSDKGNEFITSPRNAWFFLVIRLVILLFYLIYFLKYRRTGAVKSIFIAIMALSLFYAAYLMDLSEAGKWINLFIYVPMFYMVCKWERTPLKEVFVFFDLMFLGTLAYAFLDFFFDICPYTEIYDLSEKAEYFALEAFRARGVLSNSLLLSMVFLFYQVSLYIRNILYGQKVTILFVLSLFGCMMCLSRTSLIGSAVLFLYYLGIVKKFKSPKLIITFVVVIVSLAVLASLFMNSYAGDLMSRFSGENVFESHRFSAFPSTFALLRDNPFGVGSENVLTEIMKYAKNTLIDDFTLDNFFLTLLASYGLLAIIPFAFYLLPFFKAFYRWGYLSRRPQIFHCFALLLLCWCLIGFSFDLEEYVTTLLLVYSMTAALWRYACRSSYKLQK